MTTSIEVTKPLNLSIDETAGALGVGRSTVYGLLRNLSTLVRPVGVRITV